MLLPSLTKPRFADVVPALHKRKETFSCVYLPVANQRWYGQASMLCQNVKQNNVSSLSGSVSKNEYMKMINTGLFVLMQNSLFIIIIILGHYAQLYCKNL